MSKTITNNEEVLRGLSIESVIEIANEVERADVLKFFSEYKPWDAQNDNS